MSLQVLPNRTIHLVWRISDVFMRVHQLLVRVLVQSWQRGRARGTHKFICIPADFCLGKRSSGSVGAVRQRRLVGGILRDACLPDRSCHQVAKPMTGTREAEEVAVDEHKAEEVDGRVVDVAVDPGETLCKAVDEREPILYRPDALAQGASALRRPCRAVNGGSGKKLEGAVRSKPACLCHKLLWCCLCTTRREVEGETNPGTLSCRGGKIFKVCWCTDSRTTLALVLAVSFSLVVCLLVAVAMFAPLDDVILQNLDSVLQVLDVRPRVRLLRRSLFIRLYRRRQARTAAAV